MLWLKQPIACSNCVLAKDWVPNWNRIFCLASKMALFGMRNAFNGLECGIVAACVHIHLYQVAAYFIGVCGVGKNDF